MFRNKHCQSAFTLIEVLVVIVIVAIVALVAVLAFGDFGRGREERIAIEQFSRVIRTAQQQAILQSSIIGMRLDRQGYRCYRYAWQGSASHQGRWVRMREDVLSNATAFRYATQLRFKQLQQTLMKHQRHWPQVVFSPNGTLNAFTLEVNFVHESSYRVSVKNNGQVTINEIKKN